MYNSTPSLSHFIFSTAILRAREHGLSTPGGKAFNRWNSKNTAVNRQWNQITAPGLYKDLTLRLKPNEPPHRVLQLLDATLVLPHIRYLTLVDPTTSDLGDLNVGRYLNETRPENIDVPPILRAYKGDWDPIIFLLQRLVCLKRLHLLLYPSYPPALLDTLAETHPDCHVSVFSASPDTYRADFTRNKWIHSPVVKAAWIVYYEHPNGRFYTEHPDRFLRNILRQAPGIKRLTLQISATPGPSSCQRYTKWLQAQPSEDEVNTHPRAQLEMLSFPLISKMTAQNLQAWSRVTDLGYLTAWTAGAIEDIALLTTIAELQPFRALKRLTLALNSPETSPPWLPAVKTMFNALPPLTYLCLLGSYHPEWLPTAILDRHGPTLTELQLHRPRPWFQNYESYRLARKGQIAPIFPADVITNMAARCPVLQTLRITVQRYRGHSTETAAYDALGRFPALHTLDLHLNCLPVMVSGYETPFPPRELTAYERQTIQTWHGSLPKWTVRDTAINSAFDETLATAIFTRIWGQKTGRSLRVLRLHPLSGQAGQYQGSTGITAHALLGDGSYHQEMGGAWQVEWDGANGMRVENRFKPKRKRGQTMRSMDLEIFESIWPSDREEKTWPMEWRSWPLQ
ncbi:hypothetical protein M747DRAFT_364697 [Aspergillus niger ATCC 13496]|uniref:Contig An15c0100, genomic contig n=3 Tax=Aspergillus niger TaxID=5061 RepID=A2R4W8_ASPNC|nr:uncharacterized protein An15g01870 [Aspergillus niger]RDH22508.1 hypothetical protein M747DRAFT_364697 [Aspergillus niger ATCC 13496]CAK42290.1 unnamed protein product [Aspergillus niger]